MFVAMLVCTRHALELCAMVTEALFAFLSGMDPGREVFFGHLTCSSMTHSGQVLSINFRSSARTEGALVSAWCATRRTLCGEHARALLEEKARLASAWPAHSELSGIRDPVCTQSVTFGHACPSD